MATTWPLTVEVDCPEPRLPYGRLVVGADGTCWDVDASTNVWVDPVTNTAMLAPLPVTSAWATTFTGNYARLRKTDYTLTTSANWVEVPVNNVLNIYLQSKGTPELVKTTATYSANQPFFVSAWVPGLKGMHKAVIIDVYLGVATSGEMILRFRADGSVELWRGGVMVQRSDRSASNLSRGNMGVYTWSPNQQFVSMLIIPCRRREILIVTDYGLCCSFADDALDVASNTNTITPSGQFGWMVPTGVATVQAAPLKFETTGRVMGRKITLRYPPPGGATFSNIRSMDPVGPSTATVGETYSVVRHDGSAFIPDGLQARVRAAADLTGDGTGSVALYEMDLSYTPSPVTTYDEPVNITTAVTSLDLAVGEDGKATLSMTTKRGTLDTLGVQQPTITSDRPIRIAVGSTPVDIFRGTLGPPQIEYEEADKTLSYSTLKFEGADRSYDFDIETFQDSFPQDGYTLAAAVTELISLCGYTSSDVFIDTNTYKLPYSPDVSLGKYSAAPERGATVGAAIQQMHENQASTWIVGWVPTLTGYTYQWRDPLQLSDTPAMTLYQQASDAVAAGVSAGLAPSRVARSIVAHYERPEANGISVIGQDSLGNLLYGFQLDASSQDPTTAPASRPRNWRGRPAVAALIDPALKEPQRIQDALTIMTNRLIPGRGLIEWTSDLLIRDSDNRPLWLTDVVTIMDTDGVTEKGRYRIIAIPEINFQFEDTAGTRRSHRRATYRGLQITAPQLDFTTSANSAYPVFI